MQHVDHVAPAAAARIDGAHARDRQDRPDRSEQDDQHDAHPEHRRRFAAPVFWMGIMLVILFASVWPILPVSGMRAIDSSGGGWRDVIDVLHHLILPTLTLALVYLAQYR